MAANVIIVKLCTFQGLQNISFLHLTRLYVHYLLHEALLDGIRFLEMLSVAWFHDLWH